MRIFTATLGTESTTFAPMATCLDDYRDGFTLTEGSCFAGARASRPFGRAAAPG
jgi:microcystin degradation protein MlrC